MASSAVLPPLIHMWDLSWNRLRTLKPRLVRPDLSGVPTERLDQIDSLFLLGLRGCPDGAPSLKLGCHVVAELRRR